jgi:hypothetical protein
VVVAQYSRQEIVDLLRKAGFRETAEDAMVELPDPVDVDHAQERGMQRGITRDLLIGQMGGSR